MPKMPRQNHFQMASGAPYPQPQHRNKFAALAEPVTLAEKLRSLMASNPMMAALANVTISWADLLLNDEGPSTMAEKQDIAEACAKAAAAHKIARQQQQTTAARKSYGLLLSQLKSRPESRVVAQEAVDTHYSAKQEWLETQQEYVEQDPDVLGMAWESVWDERYEDWFKHATKDIHRDAHGEPEVCRFFNAPGGCRLPNGKKCPYKHVAGAVAEPCRFFNSPRGCKNGSSCPFSHVQEGPSWRAPPVLVMECKFYRSPRGCAKGLKCPYKH